VWVHVIWAVKHDKSESNKMHCLPHLLGMPADWAIYFAYWIFFGLETNFFSPHCRYLTDHHGSGLLFPIAQGTLPWHKFWTKICEWPSFNMLAFWNGKNIGALMAACKVNFSRVIPEITRLICVPVWKIGKIRYISSNISEYTRPIITTYIEVDRHVGEGDKFCILFVVYKGLCYVPIDFRGKNRTQIDTTFILCADVSQRFGASLSKWMC